MTFIPAATLTREKGGSSRTSVWTSPSPLTPVVSDAAGGRTPQPASTGASTRAATTASMRRGTARRGAREDMSGLRAMGASRGCPRYRPGPEGRRGRFHGPVVAGSGAGRRRAQGAGSSSSASDPRLVPAPEQRDTHRPELARRDPGCNGRVTVHELERRGLVGRLEDADPRVRPAERRADQHDDALVEEALDRAPSGGPRSPPRPASSWPRSPRGAGG